MTHDYDALEQDALISLWRLDLTRISGKSQWFYFCNQLNYKREPFIVFDGVKYNSLPVNEEGFARSSTGVSSRPKLTLGNIDGLFTGLITEFGGLIGADIIRYIVPAKSLDAVNFNDGNNPNADPTDFLAQRFVVQSATETSISAELELSWITELENVTVPVKNMFASVCAWEYRGVGCGYKGRPVADINDIATDDPELDQCSKNIQGCRARWGANAVLPMLAFPGIDKL